jgi:lysozyme family protein
MHTGKRIVDFTQRRRNEMADFSVVYPWTLAFEDLTPPRYEPNLDPTKTDPGAQALSGINSAAWPEDFAAIVAIPQAQRGPAVQQFYEKRYWNEWYAQLASDEVAKRVFDMGFNTYPTTAVKLLQMAINNFAEEIAPVLTRPALISVDGVWGPQTIYAANSYHDLLLVSAFQQLRVAHYKKYDANNKALPQLIARALR